MSKTKVNVLLPFVQDKKSYGSGDILSLEQDLAYKLALKNVVEFVTKKEFLELDKKLKDEALKASEAEMEAQNKAAAILEKEKFEDERIKLQIRVDEITNLLGDGEDYYKSYMDLGKGK